MDLYLAMEFAEVGELLQPICLMVQHAFIATLNLRPRWINTNDTTPLNHHRFLGGPGSMSSNLLQSEQSATVSFQVQSAK